MLEVSQFLFVGMLASLYGIYSALQVSCLAGVVNEQLSMSLYKLIAFVLCTITELSHCLFTLSSGQLSCKALYNTATVTTAGMRCTGTNCETTMFVNIITKVMNPGKCCNTVP